VVNKTVAYVFDVGDSVLSFRTNSYRAEKGSLLHSGIYNRETASVFSAAACMLLAGFFFARMNHISAVYFAAAFVLFVLLFIVFRTFIFSDAFLQVVIDKKNNIITVVRRESRLLSRKLLFPLAELENIRADYKEFSPEDSDGTRFVEKIAIQHGTVIPGFGSAARFYTVEFEFRDMQRVMVFSSGDYSEAGVVTATFKKFLERL
jgi:hypothetical protein